MVGTEKLYNVVRNGVDYGLHKDDTDSRHIRCYYASPEGSEGSEGSDRPAEITEITVKYLTGGDYTPKMKLLERRL